MKGEGVHHGRDEGELRILRDRYVSLTAREHEVMARVVAGASNKEIAALLGMGVGTVKVHRSRLMQKMKASSFAELVQMASRLGG